MADIQTDFVPGDPRIAYDHLGMGDVVLFLHGIGGNRTNWRDQLPAFVERFHAVASDARGYGLSDDYSGPLNFGDFATVILRLLDHLSVRTAHIVGLSMGGRIALGFMARSPDRVKTLTLSPALPKGHLKNVRNSCGYARSLWWKMAKSQERLRLLLRELCWLLGRPKVTSSNCSTVSRTSIKRAILIPHFLSELDLRCPDMDILSKIQYVEVFMDWFPFHTRWENRNGTAFGSILTAA